MRPVTIIIPAHNSAGTLRATLASLASEISVVEEFIVVDDASTDGTADVARAAAEEFSLPLRIISADCRDAGAARNRGLDEARAEWVYFFDADDVHLPGGLRGLYAASRDGADVILGPYQRMTDSRTRRDKKPRRYSPNPVTNASRYVAGFHRTLALGSLLIRRSTIGNHRFPTGLAFDEDTIFWVKVLLEAKIARSQVPTVVYLLDTERANRRFRLGSRPMFERWSEEIAVLETMGVPRWAGDYRRGSVALKMARVHYAARDFRQAAEFLDLSALHPNRIRERVRLWRYKVKLGVIRWTGNRSRTYLDSEN